jgi:hypothetical protein
VLMREIFFHYGTARFDVAGLKLRANGLTRHGSV